jgi:7-cyano-7-deazaguanine synthase in queuosine biosynthesis
VAGQYRATAALQTDEDVQEEVKQRLCLQDTSSYYEGFDRLTYRCDKCLNRHGDCVEK